MGAGSLPVAGAVAFLTRLPVPGRLVPGDLARSAAWFPVVGLLVGGVAAGVHALAALALPDVPATLLALAAAVLVTGALHEDGLADCADGFGAFGSRERKLEVMRDPRVGAFGALSLMFAALFAVACLAPLSGEEFARAVVVAHVAARWAPLPHAWLLAPARRDGAGAAFTVGAGGVVFGAAVSVAVALGLGGLAEGATALGVVAAVCLGWGLLARRVLGGVTGDTHGAAVKLCELGAYAAFAASFA